MFRSSTIRSTGESARVSIASRPLPASAKPTSLTSRRDAMIIRRMVGESSMTSILLVLIASHCLVLIASHSGLYSLPCIHRLVLIALLYSLPGAHVAFALVMPSTTPRTIRPRAGTTAIAGEASSHLLSTRTRILWKTERQHQPASFSTTLVGQGGSPKQP